MNSDLRTPLARARGLGSARAGVHHWWAQRLTAIALIPLVVWFAISLVMMSGADYGAVRAWIGSPVVMVLLILTIAIGLHHGQLGLQVVIEDYVHGDGWKLALIVAVRFIASVVRAGRHRGHPAYRIRRLTMAEASNGKSYGATAGTVTIGGNAYKVVDHEYDVVVVGAGGAGPARHLRPRGQGAEDRLHHQGVPDPQPHRGGAGRHLGLARQHGPGRLALAHVRHRQGLGLAGRPGRHRIHGARGGTGDHRARALRRAVQPHARGQDLPAAVRRHDDRVRQGHRPAHLRRRRPHRPRHPAHALPAVAQEPRRILHRVFRPRPHHGRGHLPRRHGVEPRRRHHPSLPRPQDGAGDRRLRPHLLHRHLGAHLHRRRRRHGAACRPADAGHGVHPVPSDRHLRRGLPDHRGRARRGRLRHQLDRRALHGALRAVGQGPRLARRREPRHDRRDPRRPRLRPQPGLYRAACRASRPQGDPRAPARHRRDGAHLRRRRRHAPADPHPADLPLQHGRHPDQPSLRGR